MLIIYNKCRKNMKFETNVIRLTENRNESRNLVSIAMVSKKIIAWYASLQDFYMWDCAPVSWPNLMKVRDTKIKTIEIFETENTRSDVEKWFDHWEKRKKIFQANHKHQSGPFTYPCYWLYRWTNNLVRCSSCRKYFCISLQINDKNDK